MHPCQSTHGVKTTIFMCNGRVKIESPDSDEGGFEPSYILPEQWPAVKAFIDQQLAECSEATP